MKRIGILETGHNPPELAADFGRYADAFAQWFSAHREAFPHDIEVYQVEDGRLPERVDACDGYLITGSAAGVYEDHAWLEPARDFVRAVVAAHRPLVGVCFGHQLVADALGGRVVKSDKGWGIGRHSYRIHEADPWMDPPLAEMSLVACHQDQVVAPPPGARVLASSAFCEHAMLVVGEHTLTIQGHPEMTPEFTRRLYETRRERFGVEATDRALATLDAPTDADVVAQWVLGFFHREATGSGSLL